MWDGGGTSGDYAREARATVARPVTTFSPRRFSAHTASSTRLTSSFKDLARTRPRRVTTSLGRTSAAKRTPSFRTVPAPAQSVVAWATKPIESMPWAKTPLRAAHAAGEAGGADSAAADQSGRLPRTACWRRIAAGGHVWWPMARRRRSPALLRGERHVRIRTSPLGVGRAG